MDGSTVDRDQRVRRVPFDFLSATFPSVSTSTVTALTTTGKPRSSMDEERLGTQWP